MYLIIGPQTPGFGFVKNECDREPTYASHDQGGAGR